MDFGFTHGNDPKTKIHASRPGRINAEHERVRRIVFLQDQIKMLTIPWPAPIRTAQLNAGAAIIRGLAWGPPYNPGWCTAVYYIVPLSVEWYSSSGRGSASLHSHIFPVRPCFFPQMWACLCPNCAKLKCFFIEVYGLVSGPPHFRSSSKCGYFCRTYGSGSSKCARQLDRVDQQ